MPGERPMKTNAMNPPSQPLLDVQQLKTYFFLDDGIVKAVDEVSFTLHRRRTLGVVGESGSGKSVMSLSILQLIAPPGRILGGQIWLNRTAAQGQADRIDLAALKPNSAQLRAIRGADIAMIFQEPMSSLSMVHTVGYQIGEVMRAHEQISKAQARASAIDLLRQVNIPKPEQRVDAYPFQLSGGMRQRAMIAMALAGQPRLLIADEPTTALDVTTQAQILELLKHIQQENDMAILLITHDLGVVAELCDDVVVMYLGVVMEGAPVDALFHDPLHPYTRALLRSIPKLGYSKQAPLTPIRGMVPDPYNRPRGCPFHPRCAERIPGKCDQIEPPLITLDDGRTVRCLLYGEGGA
jgi:peptide/nickel transport system ATP-binding protein